MFLDLIIGIAASLIASLIAGFLGNKAISKQKSIILKVYVLFLSMSVFASSAIISIILNKDFCDRIEKISEVNLLRFYHNCINSFVFIIGIAAFVSLIVIGIEAYDRGARRDHKENMDRYDRLKGV